MAADNAFEMCLTAETRLSARSKNDFVQPFGGTKEGSLLNRV